MLGCHEFYKFIYCCLLITYLVGNAEAQRVVARKRALQVQVLSKDNRALRAAKVILRNFESQDLVTETDRVGNADFYEIPAGDYTLVVEVGGREVHRNEISLREDGFEHDLVRLNQSDHEKTALVVPVSELAIPKGAQDFYSAGKKAADVGDWRNAEVALNKAIAAYPKYARAFNALGVVLAITAKPQDAELAFRRSTELNPASAEPHFNLGRLLLQLNRASEATKELEASVDLGGRTPSAIELLLESMFVTHDEDGALAFLRTLDAKRISHSPALHLQTGSVMESLSKFESAFEQYSVVLSENASESERRAAESALFRLKH